MDFDEIKWSCPWRDIEKDECSGRSFISEYRYDNGDCEREVDFGLCEKEGCAV